MNHRWIDEPLVRFVAIGAIVFAIDYALRPADVPRIEITPEFAAAIARRETERTGAVATDVEIEAAITRFVREEALYREAIALGLDGGDLIVRRRLVQKMELWLDARAEQHEPTDEELTSWHEAHADALRAPGRTAIQIAFFTDEEGAGAALATDDPAARSQPFPHGPALGPRTDAQIDALFGEGVAARLASVAIDRWSPPIVGRGGTFLLRPTERIAGRTPPLEEVRDRARREVIEVEREQARERAVREIVQRWDVVRSDRSRR